MFHFPQPPNIVHFYSRFVFNQELSMVLMLLLFVTSVEWLNKRRPLFLLSAVMPVTLMELGCLSCGTSRLWVPWWWSVLLFNAFSCPFPACWKLELSLAPGSSLSFGEKELSRGAVQIRLDLHISCSHSSPSALHSLLSHPLQFIGWETHCVGPAGLPTTWVLLTACCVCDIHSPAFPVRW